MAWAGAGAAGVAGGGNLLSNVLSWGLGEASANRAWRKQKKILKNQIQWRVADMRAAGLNPLLAVSGGVSGGAGAAPMGRGSGGGRLGSEIVEAYKTGKLIDSLVKEQKGKATEQMMKARAAELLPALMEAQVAAQWASNVRDTAQAGMFGQNIKIGKIQEAVGQMQKDLMVRNVPSAASVAEFDKTEFGKWVNIAGHIVQQIIPLIPRMSLGQITHQ